MQKTQRKNYSEEFKLEAVELAKRTNNTIAAKELGISETAVRTWRKKLQSPEVFKQKHALKKSYSDLEKENKRLAKENGYLKEINRVLKKSTAIFSADHMGNSK